MPTFDLPEGIVRPSASPEALEAAEAHLDERERGLRWAMTHDMCWGSPQRYRSFLLKERHNRNLSQRPETE